MIKTKKLPEWKRREVEEIKKLVSEHPIFSIVDLENLPTPQLQSIKAKLKNSMQLKMAKKRLIRIALNEAGMEKVAEGLSKMPALVFTNENPFKLGRLLTLNRSFASAKPGQTSPQDIFATPGPTNFAPGPIIGELGRLGIKTAVEDGKVVIKNKVLLVREGEVIRNEVADMLLKLGIKPREVGLNLVLAYEGGIIYGRDVLSIDDRWYMDNLVLAASNARALALGINYITEDILRLMIAKAHNEAMSLAPVSGQTQSLVREEQGEQNMISEDKERHAAATTEEKEASQEKKPKKAYFKKDRQPTAQEIIEDVEKETAKEENIEKIERIAKDILSGGRE